MDSSSAPLITDPRYLDLLERINRLQRAIHASSRQLSIPSHILDQNLRSESIWRFLSTRTHVAGDDDEGGQEGFSGSFSVVCRSHFSGDESIVTLGCRHEYHALCIHAWLLCKNYCPVCRQPAIEELE